MGWVESTRGVPVAGALVSIFGKGIRGGSLVTLADSQGQFVLPSLPAGSYTLRAIGSGHEPSAARHVTVLPNRDALYTLSLTPVGEKPAAAQAAAEDTGLEPGRVALAGAPQAPLRARDLGPRAAGGGRRAGARARHEGARSTPGAFDGSVELAATGGSGGGVPDARGLGLPAGMGSLQLQGRLTEGVSWTLGGLMSENEGRTWRMAAEFVLEPGAGHQLQVGAGYGAGDSPEAFDVGLSEPGRALGAVFVRDRWQIGERLKATAGARYTYLGFLPDSHHADAVVEVEVQSDRETVVRGSFATRTLTPGGDLLTLSTVAASPAITWARLDEHLRPGRSLRYEVGVSRTLGSSAHLGAQLFSESTERRAAHGFRGRRAVRAQLRHARGEGVRRDARPPLRKRRRRLGHLHLRAGPPLGHGRSRRPGADDGLRRGRVPRPRGAGRDLHRLVRHARCGAVPARTRSRTRALPRARARAPLPPRPASTSSSRRDCRSSRR